MFGFGKVAPVEDPQRDKEIAQLKAVVFQLLDKAKDAEPELGADLSEQLKALIKADKLLPLEFKNKATKRMRVLECDANMRVADRLIREATLLTGREQMRDRGQKLAESRLYFSKVCSLGGDADWKKAYQRLSETLMMSGGIQREGNTRAKPLSMAPKTPNRAKA